MTIDATFWVAISFVVFCGGLIYLKVPQKVFVLLNEKINEIKNEINEAEKLKEDAKNLLNDYENKISKAQEDSIKIIKNAKDESEKLLILNNEKFFAYMENKKKSAKEKIDQMKKDAIEDVKNTAIKVTFEAVENLIKNSIDKNKLNIAYKKDLEQAKIALKKTIT